MESLESQFQIRNRQTYNQDEPNYEYDYSCFSRYSFYLHCLTNMRNIKKRISEKKLKLTQNQQNKDSLTTKNYIQLQDVPNLKHEDESSQLKYQIEQRLKQIINQENRQSKNLTWADFFKISFKLKKLQFILIFVIVFLELVVTRICFSVFIYYVFQSLLEGNLNQAYIYGGICSFIYILYITCFNTSQYLIVSVSAGIRYGLINLIIKKIISLPQYSVKKAEIGKIMNLISNDLNMIEDKIQYIPKMFIFPFYFVAVNTLIVVRYGWQGVLGAIFMLLGAFFGYAQTKITTDILDQVNLLKDQRIKYISEIVSGIKFIKIYAWEKVFQKMINLLRFSEIQKYYAFSFWKGVQRGMGASIGNLSGYIIALALSLTQSSNLNTAKIFSILQVFLFYRVTLIEFALSLMCFQQAILIFNRYASILNIEPENLINIQLKSADQIFEGLKIQINTKKQTILNSQYKPSSSKNLLTQIVDSVEVFNPKSDQKKEQNQIIFKQFSAFWSPNSQIPVLKNINLSIREQSFVGIAGRIGSGKSSLILAIIKQIPYYKGEYFIKGSIAYVQQAPIIFSATIKQNILFGKRYNQYFYNLALTVSCFDHDLKNMPNGDDTLVGQKGITLSGGQKARLALARAINADADTLILDDPFSAVDSKVGKMIYQNLMKKMKGLKTIILATHHVQYLQDCDEIIYLKNGEIQQRGVYEKLRNKLLSEEQLERESKKSMISVMTTENNDKVANEVEAAISFYKQENVTVTWRTYWRFIFFAKINFVLFPLAFLTFVIAQLSNIFAFRFLAAYDLHKAGLYQFFNGDDKVYWATIGVLFGCYFLLSILKFALLYIVVLNSNKHIHAEMVNKIMRSPISYFDYTPSGQIINKFSNDIGIMDYVLAFNIVNTVQGFVVTLALPINIYQVNVLFIIPGLLLMIFIIGFFLYIKEVIVQTKQLDLRQKSPLFSQLAQTIDGLIQQKIYGMLEQTKQKFKKLIDSSNRSNFTFWLMNKIFLIYIIYFGLFALIGIIFIGIHSSTGNNTGLYAMSVVIMIQIIDYFGFFLRQVINMESNMVSVARGFLVIDLQSQEEFYKQYDQKLGIVDRAQENKNTQTLNQQSWPKHPKITIKNLSMKYRKDLPLTLINANLNIKEGEKIGIIGRTGAGKSSIIQSLLRLTQPEKGTQIYIDKADALKMGLHSLRRHISVIPQNSFFFKNTIRRNLDPFEIHSQQQLIKALKDSNLLNIVQKLPQGLDTNITSISSIFSQGEQQLLSLTRVLLQNNKILILDEATSSVDNQTDVFIQNRIKEKFKQATVITIAHRLLTIAGYDKVAVLNKGQIVQCGSSYELILKKGYFYEMVSHSGNSMQKIIQIAKQKHEQTKIIQMNNNNQKSIMID